MLIYTLYSYIDPYVLQPNHLNLIIDALYLLVDPYQSYWNLYFLHSVCKKLILMPLYHCFFMILLYLYQELSVTLFSFLYFIFYILYLLLYFYFYFYKLFYIIIFIIIFIILLLDLFIILDFIISLLIY